MMAMEIEDSPLSASPMPSTPTGGVELPFGPGRRFGANAGGIVGKLIEGWQINGILNLNAGAPQFIQGFSRATCTQCSNIKATIKEGFDVPKDEDPNGWFVSDIATISA